MLLSSAPHVQVSSVKWSACPAVFLNVSLQSNGEWDLCDDEDPESSGGEEADPGDGVTDPNPTSKVENGAVTLEYFHEVSCETI
jgi:hypothetical protein